MSCCVCVFVGAKPDHNKTGSKPQLRIIQDPHYRRYGNTVDMNTALATFTPHESVLSQDIMRSVLN